MQPRNWRGFWSKAAPSPPLLEDKRVVLKFLIPFEPRTLEGRDLKYKFEPIEHVKAEGLHSPGLEFQDIKGGIPRRQRGAGVLRAGWNPGFDMDDSPLAVQPEDIDGKRHVFHPESVEPFLLKDKKHPLIFLHLLTKHEPLRTLFFGQSQLGGDHLPLGKKYLDILFDKGERENSRRENGSANRKNKKNPFDHRFSMKPPG